MQDTTYESSFKTAYRVASAKARDDRAACVAGAKSGAAAASNIVVKY